MTPEDVVPVQTTTALALRGQLERAQERLATADKKFYEGRPTGADAWFGLGVLGMLGGAVTLFVCMCTPVAPIAVIVGTTGLFGGVGGIGIGTRVCNKAEKNLRAAKATVASLEQSAKPVALICAPASVHAASEDETHGRLKGLVAAAESEIDLVLAKVQPKTGLELPFLAEDHSRKIVRIETLDTREIVEGHEIVRAVTTVTARIYDAVAQDNGMLNLGAPVPDVPAFRRAVAAPEKRLPRGKERTL